MEDKTRGGPAAPIARPLAFTLIMVYGLASFLLGYQDWHGVGLLPGLSQVALIVGGLLLGSAAVRVILRRHRAFGRVALALAILFAADLAGPMLPGAEEDWRHMTVRLALSALILVLLRVVDRVVVPRGEREDRESPPAS